MSQFWLRVCQFTIAAGVLFGSIWLQEYIDYKINPMIIAAWSFMAAYGFTLAYVWLAGWRARRIDAQQSSSANPHQSIAPKRSHISR